MSPPAVQASVHAVIVDPDDKLVLTREGQLPRLDFSGPTRQGLGVAEAFAALLERPVALLRLLDFRKVSDSPDLLVREAAWQLDPLESLPHGEWLSSDQLPETQRRWAEAALAPAPAVRPPWQRPGWEGQVLGWLDAQLSRLGYTRTGALEPVKHWQISWLRRVPTNRGPLYLKAVPDFFAREVAVTRWLAEQLPGAAPPLLVWDDSRHLMLMPEVGQPLPETLEASLRLADTLGALHRTSASHLPELRSLGLPEHGPSWLRAELPGLLSEVNFLGGYPGGLSLEESAALLALRPRLEAACDELAASPIPLTLGHGDLHTGNAVEQAAHIILLDWSDASITFPFLDATPGYLLPPDSSATDREAFTECYLSHWQDLLPLPELRRLFDAASLLAEVYRALGYTRGIRPNVEGKDEWGSGHLPHLRNLLRRSESSA